jgi:hypothetical protein
MRLTAMRAKSRGAREAAAALGAFEFLLAHGLCTGTSHFDTSVNE